MISSEKYIFEEMHMLFNIRYLSTVYFKTYFPG